MCIPCVTLHGPLYNVAKRKKREKERRGWENKVSHIYIIIKHCDARSSCIHSHIPNRRAAIPDSYSGFQRDIPGHQPYFRVFFLSLSCLLSREFFSSLLFTKAATELEEATRIGHDALRTAAVAVQSPGFIRNTYTLSILPGYFAAYIRLVCKSRTILDFTRVNYSRERERRGKARKKVAGSRASSSFYIVCFILSYIPSYLLFSHSFLSRAFSFIRRQKNSSCWRSFVRLENSRITLRIYLYIFLK